MPFFLKTFFLIFIFTYIRAYVLKIFRHNLVWIFPSNESYACFCMRFRQRSWEGFSFDHQFFWAVELYNLMRDEKAYASCIVGSLWF